MSYKSSDNDAHLFLVFSPLHLLQAIAIADKRKLNNAYLVICDDKRVPYTLFFDAIKTTELFKGVHFLKKSTIGHNTRFKARGHFLRIKAKKNMLKELSQFMSEIPFKHVYTGNDGLHFQYCISFLAAKNHSPIGYYLDDGCFTYIGRKQNLETRALLLYRKCIFGWWFHVPPTIGASHKIQKMYVMHPELVRKELKQKTAIKLDEEYWGSDALLLFGETLMKQVHAKNNINDYDVLITFPSKKILLKQKLFYQKLIETALLKKHKILAKYHPLTQGDPLNLEQLDIDVAHEKAPYEIFIPQLKESATVHGSYSSTLLTTKLIRPEINVFVYTSALIKKNKLYQSLYEHLGIEYIKEIR